MQRDEVFAVKAEQHARRPFRRQIRPDLPKSVFLAGGRAASTPVSAIAPAIGLSLWLGAPFPATLSVIPHGLVSWPQAAKNQRDLGWTNSVETPSSDIKEMMGDACYRMPYFGQQGDPISTASKRTQRGTIGNWPI